MYWNRPLIECRWPQDPDPLPTLLKQQHMLFWDPEFDFQHLRTNQRLSDLCAWANRGLSQGIESFVADDRNHYDIANLVKLNLWAKDIQQQGIVKPWLILDWGNYQEAGTGDSRLRLCEIMPEIRSVPAFISTRQSRADLYDDLVPVRSLDQLASYCGAQPGQRFLFRSTDEHAPFGVYWYEYDSERTRAVTPGQDWCVTVFETYWRTSCAASITPGWFLSPVDWYHYAGTVQ
jgi:hypothetical protein